VGPGTSLDSTPKRGIDRPYSAFEAALELGEVLELIFALVGSLLHFLFEGLGSLH